MPTSLPPGVKEFVLLKKGTKSHCEVEFLELSTTSQAPCHHLVVTLPPGTQPQHIRTSPTAMGWSLSVLSLVLLAFPSFVLTTNLLFFNYRHTSFRFFLKLENYPWQMHGSARGSTKSSSINNVKKPRFVERASPSTLY